MIADTAAGHSADWRGEVLRFWFGLDPKQWWNADEALDHQIRERFARLSEEKRALPASSFLADPLTALAAVVLFDQFSRHIYRGHADQFATDPLALGVAKGAVDRGFDAQLDPAERAFLYMPFQHSESVDDQNRSMLLFTALGDPDWLRIARNHHDVIARFGRFPHRNAMLGRAPRADEAAAGDIVPW